MHRLRHLPSLAWVFAFSALAPAVETYKVLQAEDGGTTLVKGARARFVVRDSTGKAMQVKTWTLLSPGLAFVKDGVRAEGSSLDGGSRADGCELEATDEARAAGDTVAIQAELANGAKTKDQYVYVIPQATALTLVAEENNETTAKTEGTATFHSEAKAGETALDTARVVYTLTGEGGQIVALDDNGKPLAGRSAKAGEPLVLNLKRRVRVVGTKAGAYTLAAALEGLPSIAAETSVEVPDIPVKAVLDPSELTLRAGTSGSVKVSVRDASGATLDQKLDWSAPGEGDGDYVSLDNTGSDLVVRALKHRSKPIAVVGKFGEKEIARMSVQTRPGFKGLQVVGGTPLLAGQDTTLSLRLRDDQGGVTLLPAEATVEIVTVEGGSARNDERDPRRIVVRAEGGAPLRIGLSVTVPGLDEPVVDTVILNARSVQSFSPVRVNLDIIDDTMAADLFGDPIASNFYVVKARIFNNLSNAPGGRREGQSILVYRDSIEVGIELEKRYDGKRKSSVPIAFQDWTLVEPSDFVREFSRPYENEPNAVPNRTQSGDALLVRNLGDAVHVGSTLPDVQYLRVGTKIVPKFGRSDAILPASAYRLSIRDTLTPNEGKDGDKTDGVVRLTKDGVLEAVRPGVAVIDVKVDGRVAQTFSVVVLSSQELGVGAEAATSEVVRVGRRLSLSAWQGDDPIRDGIDWAIASSKEGGLVEIDKTSGFLTGKNPGYVLLRATISPRGKPSETRYLLVRVINGDGDTVEIKDGTVIQGLLPATSVLLKPRFKDVPQPRPGEFTYVSKDTRVATVVDGLVTATGPGTTTIDVFYDPTAPADASKGDGAGRKLIGRIVVNVATSSDTDPLPPSVFRYRDRILQVKHLFRYRPYSDEMIIASFEARENQSAWTIADRVSRIVQTVGAGLTVSSSGGDLGKVLTGLGLVRDSILSNFPSQRDVRRQNLVNMLMPRLIEIPFGGESAPYVLLFPKRSIGGMLRGHQVRIAEIDTSYFNVTVGVIDKVQNRQDPPVGTPAVIPPGGGDGPGG